MSGLQTLSKTLIRHVDQKNIKDFCIGDVVTYTNNSLGVVISIDNDLLTIFFSRKINYYDSLFKRLNILNMQIRQELDSFFIDSLKNVVNK